MNVHRLIRDSSTECHCTCGRWSLAELMPDDALIEEWRCRQRYLFDEHVCRQLSRDPEYSHREIKIARSSERDSADIGRPDEPPQSAEFSPLD